MNEGKKQYKAAGVNLSKQAEALLAGKPVELNELSLEDTQRLIHELQAHQIELTLQNEALQQAQQEFELSRNKYADLYDFAPVGYFTVDKQGLIIEANLTGATMLGVERSALMQQPLARFVAKEDLDVFYLSQRALFVTQSPQICEIKLVKSDETYFEACLEGIAVVSDEGQVNQGRFVVSDITKRKRVEESLQESQKRYQTLLEAVTDYIYTVEVEHEQVVAATHSPGCVAVTGYNSQDYEANPNLWYRMIYEEDRARVTQKITNVLAGVDVDPFEHRIIHKDGTTRWLKNTWVPRYDERGRLIAYDGLISDVTTRKQAEEILKMHARVLENMVEGVNVSDEQGIIHFTNPAFDAMFGYERGELIGQHVSVLDIGSTEQKSQIVDAINEHLRAEGVWFGEFENRKRDGTPFTTYARISLLEMPDRRYRISVQEDITERRQAEEETTRLFEAVDRQREQLRALTRRLTDIQEAERKQLARELHDQIGQNLTALGLNLNIIRSQIPESLPSVELLYDRIDDSLMLTEQTTERIRDVMANLHPPVLDDYGLVAALSWYGKRFAAWGGFEVVVEGEELKPRLNTSIENALFRIVQEALTNVAKHAQASRVRISIDEIDNIVRLIIADDGQGFDNTFLSQPIEQRGWGLLSMIERAEAIGGHCQIDSSPNQGTQITVEVVR